MSNRARMDASRTFLHGQVGRTFERQTECAVSDQKYALNFFVETRTLFRNLPRVRPVLAVWLSIHAPRIVTETDARGGLVAGGPQCLPTILRLCATVRQILVGFEKNLKQKPINTRILCSMSKTTKIHVNELRLTRYRVS